MKGDSEADSSFHKGTKEAGWYRKRAGGRGDERPGWAIVGV